ncbi:hepatitis A virus cellular receptor 2 homolog isoform X1 [Meriones unguiculatus]|uniref:hepatitis A virus cellular receptor 2 homolog isoform X1 n=1 Tax=Meriones unguiculatus TaxID=10047 RepID=UPI000B4FC612|nr:hepatitis A virus cellular receptor 2 homolog isoform X1 [Meriones unguiculatus]XP_021502086.1 hepatitis A virus cellular receptor 2 homolog isoform X1 [Meriones unguiculatus]XP_021502087.1 hepatitis A virus cellular receptor 2 isoform X1 [Meriones unguiculatus]
MFSCLTFNSVLLLLHLLLARSLEAMYKVEVGKNAYLPCNYTLPPSGTPVPVCWGQGPCPLSQCANGVLSTNEKKVTYKKSKRYRLTGKFYKGDVSLTIENVTLADSGTYCCRIQYPGLWNDVKLNLELDIIKPAKITPAGITHGASATASPRMLTTELNGSETQTLGTLVDKNQTKISTLADEMEDSGETIRTAVYIGVGVSAGLALALIFAVLVLKWYSYKKKKTQNLSLITLANFPPVGLTNAGAGRVWPEENIYTIEENVYEMESSNEYYCYVNSRQPS